MTIEYTISYGEVKTVIKGPTPSPELSYGEVYDYFEYEAAPAGPVVSHDFIGR